MKREPRRYYPCTDKMWLEVGREECARYSLSPREFFAGSRAYLYTVARWAAWSRLVSLGCSYKGIGETSGFDHTTVRHAILSDTGPYPCGNPGRRRILCPAPPKRKLITMPEFPSEMRERA